MDREAIARDRRRRQAEEHLDLEREREAALRDRLEEVIGDQHGPAVDEAAFGGMAADEVEIVREAISGAIDDQEPFVEEWVGGAGDEEEDPAEQAEAEIARLGGELENSRRRQRAFEAYLAALDRPPPAASG